MRAGVVIAVALLLGGCATPPAVYPPFAFDRWVEPEAHAADVLQCMAQTVGRTTGSSEATARQIRATCPDPARTQTQLGPAEIRS